MMLGRLRILFKYDVRASNESNENRMMNHVAFIILVLKR
jgi:hypothetical protein